jgi:hypothetical protein
MCEHIQKIVICTIPHVEWCRWCGAIKSEKKENETVPEVDKRGFQIPGKDKE